MDHGTQSPIELRAQRAAKRGLNSTDLRIYDAWWNRANDRGEVWATVATISADTGIAEKTISNANGVLSRLGLRVRSRVVPREGLLPNGKVARNDVLICQMRQLDGVGDPPGRFAPPNRQFGGPSGFGGSLRQFAPPNRQFGGPLVDNCGSPPPNLGGPPRQFGGEIKEVKEIKEKEEFPSARSAQGASFFSEVHGYAEVVVQGLLRLVRATAQTLTQFAGRMQKRLANLMQEKTPSEGRCAEASCPPLPTEPSIPLPIVEPAPPAPRPAPVVAPTPPAPLVEEPAREEATAEERARARGIIAAYAPLVQRTPEFFEPQLAVVTDRIRAFGEETVLNALYALAQSDKGIAPLFRQAGYHLVLRSALKSAETITKFAQAGEDLRKPAEPYPCSGEPDYVRKPLESMSPEDKQACCDALLAQLENPTLPVSTPVVKVYTRRAPEVFPDFAPRVAPISEALRQATQAEFEAAQQARRARLEAQAREAPVETPVAHVSAILGPQLARAAPKVPSLVGGHVGTLAQENADAIESR